MDELDRRIVNTLQHRFPVCERPFRAAATELGTTEEKLIARVDRLLAEGTLTRFGPLFQVERMGGAFTLAAMSVPPERFDKVAEVVNSFPEVAHNYAREHALNMWFVLATEGPEDTAAVVRAIERRTGLAVLLFPKEREFFVELKLEAPSAAGPSQGANCAPASGGSAAAELASEAASVGVHHP
ncbi:MAG TPA: AsnC family transcriptional regulator [Casimicrobiaceae bacterium]